MQIVGTRGAKEKYRGTLKLWLLSPHVFPSLVKESMGRDVPSIIDLFCVSSETCIGKNAETVNSRHRSEGDAASSIYPTLVLTAVELSVLPSHGLDMPLAHLFFVPGLAERVGGEAGAAYRGQH